MAEHLPVRRRLLGSRWAAHGRRLRHASSSSTGAFAAPDSAAALSGQCDGRFCVAGGASASHVAIAILRSDASGLLPRAQPPPVAGELSAAVHAPLDAAVGLAIPSRRAQCEHVLGLAATAVTAATGASARHERHVIFLREHNENVTGAMDCNPLKATDFVRHSPRLP